MKKTYKAITATELFGWAYYGWDTVPYVVMDDGIYMSEEHRCVLGIPLEPFNWTPAYDMDWLDAPDPKTAPILPIPFTAQELAACMLDGAGSMIPAFLECRIGDSESKPNLDRIEPTRNRKELEVLREAFALVDEAVKQVGDPNYEELSKAHALMGEYSDENDLANKREGVFAPGIGDDEYRARRDRAVDSVADLKARAEQAQATATQNWKTWRKDMVRHLFGAAPSTKEGTEKKLSQDQELEIVTKFKRGKGDSVSALAREYGVSRPTIDKILQRAGVKKRPKK